jgi:hypothetical protein
VISRFKTFSSASPVTLFDDISVRHAVCGADERVSDGGEQAHALSTASTGGAYALLSKEGTRRCPNRKANCSYPSNS